MDLSIIIVTYNSEKYIKNCIDSIYKNVKNLDFEIIVVDNNSSDNTLDILKEYSLYYKNIIVIKSENNGFNSSNNKGIKVSKGKYICLLNPDTILLNNAFKIIIDGMEKDESIGMAGGKLYDIKGQSNLTLGSFPGVYETLIRSIRLRTYKYYFANSFASKRKKILTVPYPSGADFIFKKDIINKVGYMDENYFLYFDETDYALKINKQGYKACIFTDAKIIHLQGKSTEAVSEFSRTKFLESYIYYNLKNLNKYQSICICFIKIGEIFIKSLLKNKDYSKDLNFYKIALKYIKKGKRYNG